MLPPILIDISETVNAFYLSEEETSSMSRYVTARLAETFKTKWEKKVNGTLHQTRNEYIKGIFWEQVDDYNVAIGLTPRQSKLAMMIEDGASPFDMKEGFEKSNKRVTKLAVNKDGSLKRDKNGQTSAGGWYLTIPFKWATSEAVAESSIFSNKMPKPIEKLVKAQTTPLRLDQIPGKFKQMGSNPTSGYKHQFNIYEGIQRQNIGSGNENRGGYVSFRRVSEATDSQAWQHPGFEAMKLMEKTSDLIDWGGEADMAIQEFLDNKR